MVPSPDSPFEPAAGRSRAASPLAKRHALSTKARAVEGRTAALIEQERANLFTQHLGNIPPATDVVVELTIDHPLKWVHGGTWEWRFPTVVAPRYLGVPGTVADHEQVTMDVVDGATSPTASVSLSVADDLTSAPSSPTHAIVVSHNTVSLAGSAGLDRDIVVRWAAPRTAPGCSLRTKAVAPSGPDAHGPAYGLLTVVPPSMPQAHFARDLGAAARRQRLDGWKANRAPEGHRDGGGRQPGRRGPVGNDCLLVDANAVQARAGLRLDLPRSGARSPGFNV